MKRSPIQRRTPLRSKPKHQPAVEREPKPMARLAKAPNYGGSTSGQAVAKESPARSEEYRRLVAAMSCADCGKPGPNQAAHANYGKGLSLKADDRTCFAMCPRCHEALDQGGGITKQERRLFEMQAGALTRAAILAAGTWPKNLPMWKEE